MPGALAFRCDMFLNVPLIADWHTVAQHCKQYVNDNLCPANRKQRQYDYAHGQKVLKKVQYPAKLGVRTTGPYNIEHTHVNGILTIEYIQVSPNVSTYTMSSRIAHERGCISYV